MRKSATIALKLHKWLGLLVGIQVLLWLLSGLYMVIVDIDFIHGDPLVRNTQKPLDTGFAPGITMARLRSDYPTATAIALQPLLDRPVYAVSTPRARHLVDALTGDVLSPLNEAAARTIAAYHYNGDAAVTRATLVTSHAPLEIRGRTLPLWKIDFDDHLATSFYIDPASGALVTRRHAYWRVFDVMWMLHIMDYRERDEVHHALLWIAQAVALTLLLSGAWVLAHRLTAISRRKQRMRRL